MAKIRRTLYELYKGGKAYLPKKKKKKKAKKTESVYFRGIKRESTESRLKRSGLSQAEIDRFKGKKYKRSKK